MEKNKNVPKLRFPEFTGEWEEKKLGEITSKISDGLHSTPQYTEDSDYYFINGNNLVNGRIIINENTKKVNFEEYLKHKKKLDKTSILISINGTIGSLALYDYEKVILGKSACYINVSEAIDKLFLYNTLQTFNIINFFTSELSGSTIKNLSLTSIKNCIINLPLKEEQTKIASFLTAVDEKLTQLKKKKTLLEQYKKGIMQKLFSQELRFKDNNNQDFPDWQEKLLGEICELITKGTTPTSIGFNFTEEGVKFIKVESLTEFGEIIPAKVAYISNECHQALKRSQLKVNDILFSIAGALGRVGIVKQEIVPSNTNQALAIIRLPENSDILVSFLAKYFVSDFIVKEIESLKAGAAQLNLSLEQLNRLIIPRPSLPEQQKIATFLSSIDEKISHSSAQIEKMEAWKKGLLQQMFC